MRHSQQLPRARKALVSLAVAASLVALPTSASALPPQGSTGPAGVVYLPMYNDGSVQVVDPVNKTVIKTIPGVGDHPIVLRALPDKSKVYVGNFGPLSAELSVIDTASNTIVKRITTLGAPYAVQTMSHDGRFLYVPTALSVVQVIDTQTDTIVRTLPIPVAPIHLEMAPDDKSFYIFTTFGTVGQFDAVTGFPLRPQISLEGIGPGWGAISADGKLLYSVNLVTSDISVIDTQEWRLVRKFVLPPGSSPLSGTLTRDDSEMWVSNVGTNDITILDAHTGAVKQVIKTANSPAYVNFSTDGRTAYVSDLGQLTNFPPELQTVKFSYFYFLPPGGTGYLHTYDTATRTLTGTTAVGGYPVAGLYP